MRSSYSGAEIVALMRRHRVTIRVLAQRMKVPMKRVREVRARGVSGAHSCWEWAYWISGHTSAAA